MKSGEVKLFVSILVVALVLVGFAVYPMMLQSTRDKTLVTPTPRPELNRATLVPSWAHLLGDPKLPYTLVEFGDYQCPTCKNAGPTVKEILMKHKDKLNFVFYHMKVADKHTQAILLGTGAEAAAMQNKFWQMHEALYDNQDMFEFQDQKAAIQSLMKVAGAIKLDVLKFRTDLTSEQAKSATRKSNELAAKLGIFNTPTFIFIPPKGKPIQLGTVQALKDFADDDKNWKDTAS